MTPQPQPQPQQQQHLIPPIIVSSYSHNSTLSKMYSSSNSTSPYALTVRQQPEKARLCSFKDKVDRRPLDPPPIVQLHRSNNTNFNDYHISANFFLHATLANANDHSDIHYVNGNRTTAGSVVQSLHKLKDTSNSEGAFFIFSDISVRIEGVFRLKFTLFQIKGIEVERICCTFSNPFRVYSPKNFPGMSESTELTRTFSDQGLRIRIRKEARAATNSATNTTTTTTVVAPNMKRLRKSSETDDQHQQRVIRQHLSYSPPSTDTQQATYYPYSANSYHHFRSSVSVPSKGFNRASTTARSSNIANSYNNRSAMSMQNLLINDSSASPTSHVSTSSPQPRWLTHMQIHPPVNPKPSYSLPFAVTRHHSFSPPLLQQPLSMKLPEVLEPSVSLTNNKSYTSPFPLTAFTEDPPFKNGNTKLVQLPALKTISPLTKRSYQQLYSETGLDVPAIGYSTETNSASLFKAPIIPNASGNMSRMRREHTS
ncbi:velvet factor-domain-containing protein [Mycotypha africana]|uniref:velvet factor-domain-containing protein n=1 Tax=Mycotypha africana TaxID=64632 RepID=UPI0023008F5C|nr:velvet factor-domain-containing protein [Mycotypha africana]KAI8987540.1 velvet factor-domain-containing protein [Mycotypha africana]